MRECGFATLAMNEPYLFCTLSENKKATIANQSLSFRFANSVKLKTKFSEIEDQIQ